MKKLKTIETYFHFALIVFIINLLKSEQKCYNYSIEISTEENSLPLFHINGDSLCQYWIPSLLYSVPIVDMNKDIDDAYWMKDENVIQMKNPLVDYDHIIPMYLYNFKILPEQFNVTLAHTWSYQELKDCYFGMSYKNGENEINETFILLNYLYNNGGINEKIFSFDQWILNKMTKKLESKLYFGFSHEHFIPNNENGIIGKCQTDKKDKFWGCTFRNMSFNGSIIGLNKGSDSYKIYFSSESHSIIFPLDFKDSFNNLTNNQCIYDSKHPKKDSYFLSCDNFFNDEGYATIELIHDNMNITLEIDNMNRYNQGDKEENENRTRIRYENYDYFIFPLIMFKKFHVQFDAEKELISFYTTDPSILQVKKEEEEEKNNKEESKALKIFITILIIILILTVLFIGFLIYKKRKESVQKNINKYNKFEDEENFQDMNEKRVF